MTVPFTAVQFTTYEEMKKLVNPKDTYSPASHIVSGGVAGALASAFTNPLDVCKTLLQTKGSSSIPEVRSARGLSDAFSIIRKMDGYKGFARGLVPRLWVHAPSAAICWYASQGVVQLDYMTQHANTDSGQVELRAVQGASQRVILFRLPSHPSIHSSASSSHEHKKILRWPLCKAGETYSTTCHFPNWPRIPRFPSSTSLFQKRILFTSNPRFPPHLHLWKPIDAQNVVCQSIGMLQSLTDDFYIIGT